MAEQTKIQWCDHTWSPWRGCAHATLTDGSEHPGCAHCYAEAMSKRNHRLLGTWGEGGVRVVNADWKKVLTWDKAASEAGVRRRVFPSLCDPFEEFDDMGWVLQTNGDVLIDWDQAPGGRCWELPDVRREFFRLIDRCKNLDFLLLTKRPQNVWRMWGNRWVRDEEFETIAASGRVDFVERQNVWLGVSVSDQRTADELIPELLKLRDLVPVLFVSVEPMLAPVNLSDLFIGPCGSASGKCTDNSCRSKLDWVIVGGESGPYARPCHVDWVRDVVFQCRDARVPVFVKQLGSKPIRFYHQGELGTQFDGVTPYPTESGDAAIALDDRKGGDVGFELPGTRAGESEDKAMGVENPRPPSS